MEKEELAVNDFMGGYRCSQAVFASYAPDFDLDPDMARKLSIGLAGGSTVGGECGAVSAAYLVIGLKYGFSHPGDPDQFRIVLDKISQFNRKFKELNGHINCPDLIGLDVLTQEGHKAFVENNIKAEKCSGFVSDSIQILHGIL